MNEYIIFDTETSGLDLINDKIIELAGIKVKNGRVIGQFNELIKLDGKIPPDVIKIHGITDKMLAKDGKDSKVVYKDFLKFIEGYPLIAHNGNGFDFPLLKIAFYENELEIPGNILIDTVEISRILNKGKISSHSGDSLGKLYGIKNENAHRALPDCKALFKITKHLLKKENKLETLHQHSKSHRLDTFLFSRDTMDELVTAINEKKDLFIKYFKKEGEESERWITPISFEVKFGGNLQIESFCHKRKENRNFNINRIIEISKTRKTK